MHSRSLYCLDMKVALSQPHPYLLNQAGGICQVKGFSFIDGKLNVDPLTDEPITGRYQLVYRCPEHESFDIKRAVSSDGTNWTVSEPLDKSDECDVCYPDPCENGKAPEQQHA